MHSKPKADIDNTYTPRLNELEEEVYVRELKPARIEPTWCKVISAVLCVVALTPPVAFVLCANSVLRDRPKNPGYTQLIKAVERNDATTVRSLLASGVKPHKFCDGALLDFEEGVSPLSVAADKGEEKIVPILLDFGADPNKGDGWTGRQLEVAAKKRHFQVVELLLIRGANINDSNGRSAVLWQAVSDNDASATEFHLAHGADPNGIDIDGEAILDYAIENHRSPDIVSLLKQHNAVRSPQLPILMPATTSSARQPE